MGHRRRGTRWLLALPLATFAVASASAPSPPSAAMPTRVGGGVSAGAATTRHSALVLLPGPPLVDRLAAACEEPRRPHPSSPVSTATGWPDRMGDVRACLAKDVQSRLAHESEARILAEQRPVIEAARSMGVTVVSRYTTVANALLVHATAEQLLAMARLPGVVSVEPAPRFRPALARSVPHVGAAALAAELGLRGQGTVIAIVDSGIDYTHAAFGGPGTAEAYAAAVAAVESITDTFHGRPLFPTARVVGGWDFVGSRYTTPELCPRELEAAGRCVINPEPDPDPFDELGHGTMVAGIAAGEATQALAPGVAPEASLVALKLYGSAQAGLGVDEAVDVVLDALEWCARVNLGQPVPGIAPERVDVINLSLGEPYGQGTPIFDTAMSRVVAAGIVVVAAAGNSGNQPYVLSAPSASPLVLSVGGTYPPGQLQVEARWDGTVERYPAVEGTVTAPLARMGRLEAELAWLGTACPGTVPPGSALGRMTLIASGDCSYREKILSAQAGGARAVIVIAPDGGPVVMTGDPTGIALAGVMIDRSSGERLRDLILAGTSVTAALDPALENADAIWSGSARGPSRHGALKPDIVAPGVGILAANLGGGAGGASVSGTSAASPHVAGAAALLTERNRRWQLGLSALDVSALLMNYAAPVAYVAGASPAVPVAVSRQGAGRLDVLAAGRAHFLARAGPLASLHLGARSSYRASEAFELPIRVHSLVTETLQLAPRIRWRSGAASQALQVELPSAPWRLDPGQELERPVRFRLDLTKLPDWSVRTSPLATGALFDELEIDGWLVLEAVDGSGQPLAGVPAAHLPFRILPRRATRAYVSFFQPPAGGRPGRLVIQNLSPHNGWVELFEVPRGAEGGDPDELAVAGGLDIQYVGARYEAPPDQPDRPRLTVVASLHETAVVPQITSLEVYLDFDGDGQADYRLRRASRRFLQGQGSEEMVVAVSRWDAPSQAYQDERILATQPSDLHSRLITLSVPLAELGLAGPRPFKLYLVHRGLTEDWLRSTDLDVAPDMALTSTGARYEYRPDEVAYRPETWTVGLAGSALATASLQPGPGTTPRPLLVVLPDNPFEWPESQAMVAVPGMPSGRPPGPQPIYLPLAANAAYVFAESAGEKLQREALANLRLVRKFRTVFDYRQTADRRPNGQWLWEFDGPEVVHVVFSPETGHPIVEYIRKLGTVWERWEGAPRYVCSSQRYNIPLSGELVDHLQATFGGPGWESDQPPYGEFQGRPVQRFVRRSTVPLNQQRFYVDTEKILPLFFSQVDGNLLSPDRVFSYSLYDFENPNIRFRGLNIPCP